MQCNDIVKMIQKIIIDLSWLDDIQFWTSLRQFRQQKQKWSKSDVEVFRSQLYVYLCIVGIKMVINGFMWRYDFG